jgi:phosphoglycerate kinase
MRKVTVEEIEVQDKRVLMRVDFNVPLEDGAITNDARIRRALPTINHVLGRGGKLVLMSHLGRPKGKVVDQLRMDPVAARLGELLGREVRKLDDCVGPDVEKAVSEMQAGDVVVLENLRFNPGDKAGDSEFVDALSRLGDVYVNDAFGTAHWADASVAGVPTKLPAAAGLLLKAEIEHLGKALLEPERPFIVALGGAKVSDKIGTVENLLRLADRVLIGGAMAYTFLAAEGIGVGDSKLEADKKDVASGILASARERGVDVKLPGDHVTARELSADAETRIQDGAIEGGWMGLDIGPATAEAFCEALEGAGTIVWNGTMGVCEMEPFSNGSKALAEKMAVSPAATIVGGGDTLAAVEMLGLQDRFDHVSTGGGAFLEFMEGKDLPGVACLPDKTS